MYSILENIDSAYANMSIPVFVQRLLKWIVLETYFYQGAKPFWTVLTLTGLTHAITIESGDDSLDRERVPEEADVIGWLSSLIKHKCDDRGQLHLSHFTVKEFLLSPPSDVKSETARKYLVNRESALDYLVETCSTYLSLDDFATASPIYPSGSDVDYFFETFPFYEHAAVRFRFYLERYESSQEEPLPLKRFFAVPETVPYKRWNLFLCPLHP
jgi:hypothetical protein